VTAAAAAPGRVTAVVYDGLARLRRSTPTMTAIASRRKWRGCGRRSPRPALFCTPEYAGTLPGSFKNLLDWTVGGGQLYGKPTAWINVAAPGRGDGAQDALASVLGYVGAVIVETACRRVPVDRAAVSPDATISDPRFTAEAAQVWDALLGYLGER
jgi:chromate reductase, NAD(P)H dehydrogenase (quinone)